MTHVPIGMVDGTQKLRFAMMTTLTRAGSGTPSRAAAPSLVTLAYPTTYAQPSCWSWPGTWNALHAAGVGGAARAAVSGRVRAVRPVRRSLAGAAEVSMPAAASSTATVATRVTQRMRLLGTGLPPSVGPRPGRRG